MSSLGKPKQLQGMNVTEIDCEGLNWIELGHL
jgi:hypothetical protein